MYVIATGNAFSGITLYGPFSDGNSASDYADEFFRGYIEYTIIECVKANDTNDTEDCESPS